MTKQDDGMPAIEGQKPIGEQPKMTNKTENQCPNCGHNTLAVKMFDDGSGKVHCKRTNCGYEDGFYPAGENS